MSRDPINAPPEAIIAIRACQLFAKHLEAERRKLTDKHATADEILAAMIAVTRAAECTLVQSVTIDATLNKP